MLILIKIYVQYVAMIVFNHCSNRAASPSVSDIPSIWHIKYLWAINCLLQIEIHQACLEDTDKDGVDCGCRQGEGRRVREEIKGYKWLLLRAAAALISYLLPTIVFPLLRRLSAGVKTKRICWNHLLCHHFMILWLLAGRIALKWSSRGRELYCLKKVINW